MKDEYTVIFREFDRNGTPGGIGVLCDSKDAGALKESLNNIGTFICPDTGDPYDIDMALAAFAEGAFEGAETENKYVIAAVTKPDSDVPDSCGAVIGMSGLEHTGADKQLTEIAESLWQWAYPGVCGFVLNGTKKEAEDCVDCIYRSIVKQVEPWTEIKEKLNGKTFIYVSDSTGKACFTDGILGAGEKKGAGR